MGLYVSGGALGGDVRGATNNNTVFSLTGNAGVVSATAAIAFTGRTSAATTGDIRGPKDFGLYSRRADDAANNIVLLLDGGNNLRVGDPSNTGTVTVNGANEVDVLANTVIAIETATIFMDGTTQTFRDTAHGTALGLVLNSAGNTSVQFAAGTTPSISQAQSTAASAVDFSITAQAAKAGTNANGGGLNLSAGAPDGSGVNGPVRLQSNGTTYWSVGNSGADMGTTSVTIAAGNNTLTAAQYACPRIVLNGNLVGSAATVILPNQSGVWWFDYANVTGTTGINFKSGTTTSATFTTPATTTAQIVQVSCRGSNTVSVK